MAKYNERGDTLVEVIIALAVLAGVLISAFTLANRSARIGLAARERSQAASLLQEQAEALRNFRDSHKWSTVTSSIGSCGLGHFHMEPNGANGWVVQCGDAAYSGISAIFKSPLGSVYLQASTISADNYKVTLAANWKNAGGGVDNTSTVYTHLANLDSL